MTLVIFKQYGGDTMETTRRVTAELDRLRPGLLRQGIDYHPALFRQADFVEHSVGNVTRASFWARSLSLWCSLFFCLTFARP